MNKAELKTILKEIEKDNEGVEGFYQWNEENPFEGEYEWEKDDPWVVSLSKRNLALNFEESYGGYEGAGETYWIVFSVTNCITGEVTYFKIDGFYASHYGCEIDMWDFYPVDKIPVQAYEWRRKEKE
jgi:hypothetical protein